MRGLNYLLIDLSVQDSSFHFMSFIHYIALSCNCIWNEKNWYCDRFRPALITTLNFKQWLSLWIERFEGMPREIPNVIHQTIWNKGQNGKFEVYNNYGKLSHRILKFLHEQLILTIKLGQDNSNTHDVNLVWKSRSTKEPDRIVFLFFTASTVFSFKYGGL